MLESQLTIVGLGPGPWEALTREASAMLEAAAASGQRVYFRTLIHPISEALREVLPDLKIESFDQLYDEASDWETLYRRIADAVWEAAAAAAGPLIYAVPGHPLVGDTTVQLLLQRAEEEGLAVRIVAGLSFVEPVCTALRLDPLNAGLQIIEATALAALHSDEVAGKLIPTTPLLVAQLYNRRLASAVKLNLSECYPDEWPVSLVRLPTAAGASAQAEVHRLALYELDRQHLANHLTTLYVPPVEPLSPLRHPDTLRYITMRLRREPDGCPWDREQTHQSLIRYVLEETYEVVEALEENDMQKLAEELGDLLLQVYLHAEIARQEGDFSIGDVFEQVNAKLIRRHPHVFGNVSVSSAGQVVQNWEAIKRAEREAAGQAVQEESLLDRVPQAAPALTIAQEYQKRAARTGFAYADLQGVLTKLTEELQELDAARTPEERLEEMGDVLFLVARAAGEMQIDAEEALRRANRKFRRRFQAMEALARQEGRPLAADGAATRSREELRALWKQAKASVDASPEA
jgi:tetrapyrrole methylase family protein/MazG family protein